MNKINNNESHSKSINSYRKKDLSSMKNIPNLDIRYQNWVKTNPNHIYFIKWVENIASLKEKNSFKVLDYGCGRGGLVKVLREAGIDCYGVDHYIPENLKNDIVYEKGYIKELTTDKKIPYQKKFFDVIFSNMVIEHIADKELTFNEIYRTLKDDGISLHHFPTKEVIIEGHLQIPFFHWLRAGKVRFWWTYLMRILGMGRQVVRGNSSTAYEWTSEQIKGMDDCFVFYERQSYFKELFQEKFTTKPRELEYLSFRLQNKMIWKYIERINWMRQVVIFIMRYTKFSAFELRKKNYSVSKMHNQVLKDYI